MKYRIEAGIETKTSLSTVRIFDNAEELRKYIESLERGTWYVVEYAKTKQEIVRRNYIVQGTVYNSSIKCPKALKDL